MSYQKSIQPIWIILGLVLIALSPMMAMPVAAAEDFTIVALPDTQYYSKDYPQIFAAQTQWIVDNKDALNIVYVAHEGDLVDDADDELQWIIASDAMSLLEDPWTTGLPDGIPYGVVPGNHDESTLYNQYFGVARFYSTDSVSFSTGNNTANGYVAQWTGISAADGSFSITAEQDKSRPEWQGSKAYAMTSIMLQEVVPSFTAYIDLNSQKEGDGNAPNVLKIVPKYVYPETSEDPPIDPGKNWDLKDYVTGGSISYDDQPVMTMQVEMDVRYPTTNGKDCAPGTPAADIFSDKDGVIVDGVGGYELDEDDFVKLTFNNLDPDKQYVVAVTYNRDGGINYSDRVTEFTIEGADTYLQDSSPGVVVNNDDSVSFSTGNNTANGYVARWTGVTAEDGSFSITAVQDTSGGGPKAYAMTSIMLQEDP
jgi:hypothetical protein